MEDQGLKAAHANGEGHWYEVLIAFLVLGCTSFGGPIAHIGYFREAFVERRKWLDGESFAALLALCQLLPGPASSQMGMAIGHRRAGWIGALAAWIGLTTPSALLMIALALGAGALTGHPAIIHGLKLAAVAVVAQAVWQMARRFARGWRSAGIAVAAALVCILLSGTWVQIAVILFGFLAGSLLLHAEPRATGMDGRRVGRRTGTLLLMLFAALLTGSLVVANGVGAPPLQELATYFRAGSLVFGGGHVVLPLLEQGVVAAGVIDRDHFLAAYGAAQALPGPLFAVAAFPGFLGHVGGIGGALLALVAIFLPGALLLFGAMPFWASLIAHPGTSRALAGANAAVVGLLAAALWNPLIRTSIADVADVLIAFAALLALVILRAPPLLVVAGCMGASLFV